MGYERGARLPLEGERRAPLCSLLLALQVCAPHSAAVPCQVKTAELALLGVGDADRMFPNMSDLEEAYGAYADEQEWRVVL